MDRTTRTVVSNILIIGSGAAGLRAGISASLAGLDVVIVGKRPRRDAHTVLAAGGINAALGNVDPEDSWEQHFVDTFQESYFLSNPRMVEILTREAPQAIGELEEWGCKFNRTGDGKIDQRYFGAHKYRRTCYAGDFTGREIIFSLDNKIRQLDTEIHEGQYITRLLITGDQCFGAFAFHIDTGDRTVYLADAVILAAGGHTRLWRRSTSRRDENTGDGMYLALQAGCPLIDVELVQFHPTGMVYPEEWAGVLVTEAVRGEGGILKNSQGDRFMERYDPERLELSTRDRVALAIYTEIIEGRAGPHGGVYLDISHLGKDLIRRKLPRIHRQFLEAQMRDISREPMEVSPSAHYSMGGVLVDPETAATAINGLFAAGEVTGGLHGANRLGGNSLAETIVFGKRAGETAVAYSDSLVSHTRDKEAIRLAHEELDSLFGDGDQLPRLLQRQLRDAMWDCCGVVRSQERLNKGLQRVKEIKALAGHLDIKPGVEGYQDLAIALDLRAGLSIAEATILAADHRKESRGAHQRYDYPDLSEELTANLLVRLVGMDEFKVEKQPVPPVPEYLAEQVAEMTEYDLNDRLLE
jgi:succinate dehydrogenase / fumarate reductase, flavoprotein subunit